MGISTGDNYPGAGVFCEYRDNIWMIELACCRRTDREEQCEVKKAMKSRGGIGQSGAGSLSPASPPPPFLFFLAPFYFAPLHTI